MTTLRRIYGHLPPPLMHVAATARGAYLRWWRYGADTEELISTALERDTWTAEQWSTWRSISLQQVLDLAATEVPYYRDLWRQKRRDGDVSSWTEIANWPILDKQVVKADPKGFVVQGHRLSRLFQDRTSGTTGTPLSVFSSRRSLRRWFATFEARVRLWHGVRYADRWVMLGGQLVVPYERVKPPFWVHNRSLHQLYVSTQHVSRDFAPAIVQAIHNFRPTHILGYPSSLAALAEAMLHLGIEPPDSLRVVFSNSEVLTPSQREKISGSFRCPVRDTYGLAEMVAAASECPHGSMHVWPDVGYLELGREGDLIDELPEVGGDDGEPGRLIATGLMNESMLLVRYDTGDLVQPTAEPCRCGRTSTVLAGIGGRASDMIRTCDGRSIFWINPIFYGMPVVEGQVVQHSVDRISIRIIPEPTYDRSHGEEIAARLRERVGDMSIEVQEVSDLSGLQGEKFRPVISELA